MFVKTLDSSFKNYLAMDLNFIQDPENLLNNEGFWSTHDGFYYLSEQPEEDFKIWSKNFKLIGAAGGMVWNNEDALLMIFRRGYWDLPKGKIEKGETNEEAALRELEEETGIKNIELQNFISSTYHIYFEKKWILKETFWFRMRSNYQTKLIPQTEEDIEQACWVPFNEIASKLKLTYSSIAEILKNTLKI